MSFVRQWFAMRNTIAGVLEDIVKVLEGILDRWALEYDIGIPEINKGRITVEKEPESLKITYEIDSIKAEIAVNRKNGSVRFRVEDTASKSKVTLVDDIYE